MSKRSDFSFDAKVIAKYIREHFKFLFWLSVIAFIASLIISLIIHPKYKSTAVIYPASYSDNKPWYDLKDNKAWFGQLYEIDHYMQILASDEVRDRIIEKYKLGDHYGIPRDHKYYRTRVNGAYEGNVSFARTRFQSIRIEVIDEDSTTAAAIANDILTVSDSIMNKIFRQKAEFEVRLFEEQYKEYMSFMNNMADSMNSIGKDKGIADVEHQSQELERAYTQALASGGRSDMFENKLKEMAQYSGTMHKQKMIIEYNADYFSKFMGSYINAKAQLKQNMPYSYKFTVDRAQVSDKKHSPKRAIIVIVSTLMTFLFALMMLIMNDYFRKLLKD